VDSLRISRLWIKFAFNQLVAETMTKPSLGMGFFLRNSKDPYRPLWISQTSILGGNMVVRSSCAHYMGEKNT
jgi:hypothetical protein